jgi:4'-phosphopantetheinyl transferase
LILAMPVVFCEIDAPAPVVPNGDTHLYVAPLADARPFLPFLTDDERVRAERFRLGRVRDQFVAARGHLRALLGRYLGLHPRAVPVLYADGGKPHLPEGYPLHFNVSHTDGLAVFAVGHTRVGVDVERVRSIPDADGLVSRFFTRRECDQFHALPTADRPGAFLRAWTRKEAVLKAIGRGVQSLDVCDVTFGEDEPPELIELEGDRSARSRWELFAWEPAVGYMAAGAVERIRHDGKKQVINELPFE